MPLNLSYLVDPLVLGTLRITQSALGGPPRKVIATGAYTIPGEFFNAPQWSADGSRLAGVVKEGDESFAEIVSLRSGASERIRSPGTEAQDRMHLSWSPDGRFFAYVDGSNQTSQVTSIRLLRLADGAEIELTDGHSNERSPSCSRDGRDLYYVSNRVGTMDLWRQPLSRDGTPAGAPERLTDGVGIRWASFSPDGSQLAYERGSTVSNLWKAPILSENASTWRDAEELTREQAYIEFFDLASDGERAVVSSDRGGNPDLWLLTFPDGAMQRLTSEWIAFFTMRDGVHRVWRVPSSGGEAEPVTTFDSAHPVWSVDGSRLYTRSGQTRIMEVSLESRRERVAVDLEGRKGKSGGHRRRRKLHLLHLGRRPRGHLGDGCAEALESGTRLRAGSTHIPLQYSSRGLTRFKSRRLPRWRRTFSSTRSSVRGM